MFYEKTKQTKTKGPKKGEKNFLQRESNPRPLMCKVNTLQTVYIKKQL